MIIVVTNNKPRPILSYWDLTKREKQEADDAFGQSYAEEQLFVRYKRQVYAMSEFLRGTGEPGWDGYHAFGFTCGLLIKLCKDGESCILAGYKGA